MIHITSPSNVRLSGNTFNKLTYMDPGYLCPDILDIDLIGEADFLRGRVVRFFFYLMRLWPTPKAKS